MQVRRTFDSVSKFSNSASWEAVRSVTGSLGQWPSTAVQNSDRRDFTGNTENTPLMSASSGLNSSIDQDWLDATRTVEIFEDGDFPALRSNYHRRAHGHHMVEGHKAPQNSIREFFTERSPTRSNSMPQQFTQPRNMATHFSPDNTLPIFEQTRQRQNSKSCHTINQFAETIAGIAFQQLHRTSRGLLKPTTTNFLIIDGKTEKLKCL